MHCLKDIIPIENINTSYMCIYMYMYMRIHTCVYIHNNIFTKVKDLSMSVVGTVLRCQPAAPTRIYSWDNSRAPALASRVSL